MLLLCLAVDLLIINKEDCTKCALDFPYMCCYYVCQPQSKNGVDSFGGLGATLIDALDTLYIMGLDEQFQRARG